jgi:CheY-like chemotaxis protein
MTGAANKPTADPAPPREARVLLVDDDRELCQMLTEYLEAEHFDVKSVHDGGDALAELRVNDFEILILDVMLPSVGGFDVLRELGASYDTPILMLMTSIASSVWSSAPTTISASRSIPASWWRVCAPS